MILSSDLALELYPWKNWKAGLWGGSVLCTQNANTLLIGSGLHSGVCLFEAQTVSR